MEESENGNFLIQKLRHWAEVQPEKEDFDTDLVIS